MTSIPAEERLRYHFPTQKTFQSFTAINFTKRYEIGQSVSERIDNDRTRGPIEGNFSFDNGNVVLYFLVADLMMARVSNDLLGASDLNTTKKCKTRQLLDTSRSFSRHQVLVYVSHVMCFRSC